MRYFRGFELPWQLRYRRAWYIRNARWHERRARDKRVRYRDWNAQQALYSLESARSIVERYRATGRFDDLALCNVRDALARMRDPRWLNGLDIINCPTCRDVRAGWCEGCKHNYVSEE